MVNYGSGSGWVPTPDGQREQWHDGEKLTDNFRDRETPAPYGSPSKPFPYEMPDGQADGRTAPPPANAFPLSSPYIDQQVLTPRPTPPLDQPWPAIPFTEAVKRFFTKAVTFSGRASPSEFWFAYLFMVIMSVVTGFIPVLGQVISFALLVPFTAVGIRRFHDANLSGWWTLASWVGSVALFAGAFMALFGVLGDTDSSDPYYMAGAEALIAGGAALMILGVALIILNIVQWCKASKPEGARFDKNFTAPYGSY